MLRSSVVALVLHDDFTGCVRKLSRGDILLESSFEEIVCTAFTVHPIHTPQVTTTDCEAMRNGSLPAAGISVFRQYNTVLAAQKYT